MPPWDEAGLGNEDDFSFVTVADTSLVLSGGVASFLSGGSLLKVLTELMASRKTWDVFSLATSSPTSSQVPVVLFFLRNLNVNWMFRQRYFANHNNHCLQHHMLSYLPGGFFFRTASTSSLDICDFPFLVAFL